MNKAKGCLGFLFTVFGQHTQASPVEPEVWFRKEDIARGFIVPSDLASMTLLIPQEDAIDGALVFFAGCDAANVILSHQRASRGFATWK